MPSPRVVKSVVKMSKVMLPMTVFLVFMCGTAMGDSSSVDTSILKSNSSSPISVSLPPKSSDISKSIPSSKFDQVDATLSRIGKSGGNSTKSDNVADGKHDNPKASTNNTSPDSSSPDASIPSGDLGRKLNPEALMRGFYVFVGLSVIVMAYIAWKTFGKRPTEVHRYGVVANREDLELAPLDSDDADGEEDDTTHFDINKHRLK
ncbi:hypothetical protein ONE63_011573 [Megalurothrips usitatus]|uniref:Uncharacterized protein n=1 Tax=Megalurothrips usitatus TaxID=439358 RepID=A0AAV7X413_9NEOP|nr:hypothetical protein ONE63_011573 [Megalurothrips usitatus]